jgi:hypothetical protein
MILRKGTLTFIKFNIWAIYKNKKTNKVCLLLFAARMISQDLHSPLSYGSNLSYYSGTDS